MIITMISITTTILIQSLLTVYVLGESVLEEVEESQQRKTRYIDRGSYLREIWLGELRSSAVQTYNQLCMRMVMVMMTKLDSY